MMRVITSKEVQPYKPVDTSAAKNIITSEAQDRVKVIDKKTGDYVIESEVVLTEKIDTKEYINSFKDDVGIENILRKFDLCKDPELFNQTKRVSVSIAEDGKELVQDYTGVPTSEEEALRLAKRAKSEFDNLPSDLVKGRSFKDFAETCTKEELLAFIQSQNTVKKEGEE